MSFNLTVIYSNKGKPNLFRISLDIILSDLNDQPNQINVCLNHGDKRKMVDVDYYCLSIDSNRYV